MAYGTKVAFFGVLFVGVVSSAPSVALGDAVVLRMPASRAESDMADDLVVGRCV